MGEILHLLYLISFGCREGDTQQEHSSIEMAVQFDYAGLCEACNNLALYIYDEQLVDFVSISPVPD